MRDSNQGAAQFSSKFCLGDKVQADGDSSIIMTVTAHLFRGAYYVTLECSWFAQQGAKQEAWIEEWRLQPEEDPA